MSTRVVITQFNTYPTAQVLQSSEDGLAIAHLIQQKLNAAGWAVWQATGVLVGTAFVQVQLTLNLDNVYDADSAIRRYLPEALTPDFVVSNISYTDLGSNGNTNTVNTSNGNTNHNMNGDFILLGAVDGTDVYRYSGSDATLAGCYTLEDNTYVYYGDCPTNNSDAHNKPNFLEQIGNSLGLTKLGVSAAAGGALALVFVAFLFTRKD
jgi:hypothetical protein